jgi:hypothetical protein
MQKKSVFEYFMFASAIVSVSALSLSIFPNLFSTALAQETSPNVTVSVNISLFADLTLIPQNYTKSLVPVGTDTLPDNFTIRNTGSTNITNIHAYVDTIAVENQKPIDSGQAGLYASTGFILIKNESGGPYAHAGRLEWNLSSNLEGEVLNLQSQDVNTTFGRGWYRNGTNQFLWKAENGTRGPPTNPATKDIGACNITGTLFSIKRDPENDTSGLQRDFTTGIIDTGTFREATFNWSLFEMNSGALSGCPERLLRRSLP